MEPMELKNFKLNCTIEPCKALTRQARIKGATNGAERLFEQLEAKKLTNKRRKSKHDGRPRMNEEDITTSP